MVAPELFGVCEQGGLAPENEFEVRISNTFKNVKGFCDWIPTFWLHTSAISPHCHPLTSVIKFRVSHSFFFSVMQQRQILELVTGWKTDIDVQRKHFETKINLLENESYFFQEFKNVKCITFNTFHKSYLPQWFERKNTLSYAHT